MKMKSISVLLTVALVGAMAGTAQAAPIRVYTGSSAWTYGWNTGTNWNPAGVPVDGDSVVIGGTRRLIVDSSTASLRNLYVAYSTNGTTATQGYLRVYGAPVYPAYNGVVTASAIQVAYAGGSTGYIQQLGGTVTATDLWLKYNKGTGAGDYYLKGGTLTTTNGYIGTNGRSTFYHSAGTYNSGVIQLGVYNYTSYGADSDVAYYNLTGGTVNASQNFILGYYHQARGHLKMGDATGATGTITGTGNMIIKNGADATGMGIVQGFGDVTMTGSLTNNGKVIADGWGGENVSDRTLAMTSFSSIATVEGSQAAGAGWYAQNRGKLVLPTLAVAGGSSTAYFGEDSAGSQKLVNSMRLAFADVNGGALGISLLAADNSETGGIQGNVVGVWKIDGSSFDFGSGNVDLNIRYDSALALALGITEADLKLYHQVNGRWVDVTSGVDTVNKFIAANDVNSFSLFAVGTEIVPEPSTLCLLGMGLLGLSAKRKRQ